MTYLYVSTDGAYSFEREYRGRAPNTIHKLGATFKKERIVFEGGIVAFTDVSDKAKRKERRHYRQNKEVAEGLATGAMQPLDNRDATGDKQPRESIAQFNRMYADAKEKAGGPIIK